jgi:hypothetical protein
VFLVNVFQECILFSERPKCHKIKFIQYSIDKSKENGKTKYENPHKKQLHNAKIPNNCTYNLAMRGLLFNQFQHHLQLNVWLKVTN